MPVIAKPTKQAATLSRYLAGLTWAEFRPIARAMRERVLVITEATAKAWDVLGAGWRHHAHKAGLNLVEVDRATGRVCWTAHNDAPPTCPEELGLLRATSAQLAAGPVEIGPDGGEFYLADPRLAVGVGRIIRDALNHDPEQLLVPELLGGDRLPVTVEGITLPFPASAYWWLADALGKLTLPDWLPVQLAEQAKEAWRRWCRRRGLSCLIEE